MPGKEGFRAYLSAIHIWTLGRHGPPGESFQHAFRPFTVSLAYITRPGGGWSRPREYQSYPRRVSGACPASLPCVSPAPAIGLAYTTEAAAVRPRIGHSSPARHLACTWL